MDVSAHRAFSLLRELAFERVSGSEEEKKAAERLLEVALSTGAQAHIEEFPVPCGMVDHARLVVTSPYEKEYEVTGYERAANTPEEGLDGEFYYGEDLLPLHLARAKGKIVMINGRLRRADYEKLQKAGVAAILTFSGTTLDRPSETDCDIRKLRETLTEPFGDAVALNLRAADAAEADVVAEAAARGLHCGTRFSPGYGDLPLSTQPVLLGALDAGRLLGITLSPALLMSPTKSVTAVVGLFERPRPGVRISCAGCPCRDFCVLLRAGSTCRG